MDIGDVKWVMQQSSKIRSFSSYDQACKQWQIYNTKLLQKGYISMCYLWIISNFINFIYGMHIEQINQIH